MTGLAYFHNIALPKRPFTFNLKALVRSPSRACVAIWGTGAPMSSLSPFFTFSHSNPLPSLPLLFLLSIAFTACSIYRSWCLPFEGGREATDGTNVQFRMCQCGPNPKPFFIFRLWRKPRPQTDVLSHARSASLPHFRPVFASATNKERVTSPSTSFAAKFHLRAHVSTAAGDGRRRWW